MWQTASIHELSRQFDGSKYYGYFQNRFGEQWVFVYDYEQTVGELGGARWGRKVGTTKAKPERAVKLREQADR